MSHKLYQAAGVISINMEVEDEEPSAEGCMCVYGGEGTQVSEKVEHCIIGITHKGVLHPVQLRVHIPHSLMN